MEGLLGVPWREDGAGGDDRGDPEVGETEDRLKSGYTSFWS